MKRSSLFHPSWVKKKKKRSQQTEGWSQSEKSSSTMRWCNAYKYCPIREGLGGLSGLVKQLKLTCLVSRAHNTKNLGTQYNPRRLSFKGTLFNLLLKIAHHIFKCFTWQTHWLGVGLVCLPGLASVQHLLLMDVSGKYAKTGIGACVKACHLLAEEWDNCRGKERSRAWFLMRRKRVVSLGLNSYNTWNECQCLNTKHLFLWDLDRSLDILGF